MVWIDIIPDLIALSHLFAPDNSKATLRWWLALFCSSSGSHSGVSKQWSPSALVSSINTYCLQLHWKITPITLNWMTTVYCEGNHGAFCCRTNAVRILWVWDKLVARSGRHLNIWLWQCWCHALLPKARKEPSSEAALCSPQRLLLSSVICCED